MIAVKLNSDAFLPGDVIDGRIRWENIAEGSTHIEARLLWYTKGKGDRNHDVIASKKVDDVENIGESAFQFTAPHRPYSFSGKLISVVWSIEVIVFPGLETEQVEVVISNRGKEIFLLG